MQGRIAPAVARLLALPDNERVLGVYHLARPLGRGGFAPVWLAREVYGDAELRTVAIKLFALDEGHTRPGMGTTGMTSVARLKRDSILAEARALCQVEHPNVVRFFAIATDASGDVLGLAMEFVQGTPLDTRLEEKGKLSIADAIDVGRAVASALAAVHAVGLVHRDVKPANVIDAVGVYKLIDFGVASSRDAQQKSKSEPVVMDDLLIEPTARTSDTNDASTGTLGYIDPACISGTAAASPASDLYSLGAMLFECIAGMLPSLAAARRAGATGLSPDVLDGRARSPALREIAPDAPLGLARVVDALLDPDPARRPRSAEAVAWELERLRREVAGRARPIPPEEKGPFRGLGRFEESDRDVYFGRGVETAGGLEMARARGLVALIGPSGSGKSSLARAGIVPAIVDGDLGGWPRRYDEASLAPGVDPRASLRAALAPFVPNADAMSPEQLVAALADRAQREGRGVVVLVDQLEELVTTAEHEARDYVVAFLARAGEQLIPGVRCVVTARRDLLDELLALGDLGRVLTRGSLFVAPLTDAAWESVVDSALEAYGYRLEDDELRASLLAQLEGTSSAMPLVQFALTELWSRRDREAKVIPRAALDDIGGIAGALEMHANATLRRARDLAPDAADVARTVLVALTTAKGSRATRTLPELFARAPGDATPRVIEALEEARLVVQEADGLTLAHEALLTRWGVLRAWVEEAREDRVAAEEVEREAAAWNDEKRPADRLLAGRRLRAANALLARSPEPLGDVARAFLGAGRARQRRARAIAAVPFIAIVALAIAGVARWDAQRVKTTHCAGYVRRWHVMECVAPLDEVARARRAFSYRFHTQQGRVLSIERVGVDGELRNDDDQEVVWEYRWEGPRVREATVLDRRGHVIARRIFSDDSKRVERRDAFGYPLPLTGTKVAVILYDFDPNGFVTRERFQTIRGAATPDEKQVFGYKWTPNAQGLHPLQEVLGVDGTPAIGKDGVARVERAFDANGAIVRERLVDVDGNAVLGELGYATREMKYDAAGSLIDERFLDIDDKPIAARLQSFEPMRSHARRAIARDAAGNPIEVAYFDAKGALTPHENWACGWTSRFDAHGHEIERTFFGADKQPVTTSEGYATRKMTYDPRGNEIERRYFGPDGKPTTHNYGNASWRKTFDAAGYETEYTLVGLDGEPVVVVEGFSRVDYKWDADHRLIEEAYFGLGDRPVQPRHLGFARKASSWRAGRLVETAYFGADGAPVLDNGSARETFAYDAYGNTVETRYFGVNGRPALYTFYASRLSKYDEQGDLVESSFLGLDGHLARGFGYARATFTYDAFGRRTGETYFDADGRRTTDLGGEGGWLEEHDDRGNVVVHTSLDVRGQPTLSRDGVLRWRARYDAQGREVERAFFGRDDAVTLTYAGYARYASRFDAVGDKIETTYFDAAGGVVRIERARFDDRHRRVERAFYDGDGKPTLGKQGYSRETMTYDERGLPVEGAFFDERGAPVVAKGAFVMRSGTGSPPPDVARWTMRFDARGLEIERASFGADGLPMLSQGAARVVSVYDGLGHKLEEHAFGVDGKPIVRASDGTAGWRAAYDEVGRQVRIEYLGVDGQRVLDADGVAGWTSRYDAASNEVERAFFGADGNPIADKSGAARWTASFDERRSEEERRFFGVDGKPVKVRGCVRIARSYDDRGKLVEKACFDEHDSPANEDGAVAREVHRYDAHGNDVEEAFYDKDGLLVARGGGYARKTTRPDARGNAVEVVYYGGDGRPMLFKTGSEEAWRVTRAFDDRNELLEVVLYGIDGRKRADANGVAIRRYKRDGRGVLTEEAFFDADDKPVVAKDTGFARRAVRYDDRGGAIEAAFFGAKGERIAPKSLGYARVLRAYDARGNEIETRYSDAADRAIAGPDGCAIVRRAFDARDETTESACFGVDDKPTPGAHGVARWVATYGAGNRELERRNYDVGGQLVAGKNGWARRTIAYDARGAESERQFFDARGASLAVKGKGD